MSKHYSIQQLSREFEVTPRTLRFYEEKGLLSPSRQGQSRIYSSADRSRLRLILRGKRLGFSLLESQQLIEMYEPNSGNQKQLKAVLAKIKEKQALLAEQLRDLKSMQSDMREWEQRYRNAIAKQ